MRPDRSKLPPGLKHLRTGQLEFLFGIESRRLAGLVARRQYGKTSLAAVLAIRKMLAKAGHNVIFGSVKLDLGREIVRKEAQVLQDQINALTADDPSLANRLVVVDALKGGKALPSLSADDFADLYEGSRLELRIKHSNTVYSRTKVVALTPAAVGETGDLILDEVGRVRDFRSVWEAVSPIIASNPKFRCILTTTPPPDDSHYSFELLAPPIGAEFAARPEGNWYESILGVPVLRISAHDAHADGVPLYDQKTGAPLTPEEARAKADDKDAWDRNYGVKFVLGGSAACSLLALGTAQMRGLDKCRFIYVENEAEVAEACAWLSGVLGTGAVGIGVDVATTTGASSNPTAVAVAEAEGSGAIIRAIFIWKTTEPAVARPRLKAIVQAVAARRAGGRARKLCVDGTNERYFAKDLVTYLRPFVPVECVVGSESAPTQPGGIEMNMKQFLGSRLVACLDGNQLTLPPHRYITDDWRLVRKEKGLFVCDPAPDGKHGDTFDGAKLALNAIEGGGVARGKTIPRDKQRRGRRSRGGLRAS